MNNQEAKALPTVAAISSKPPSTYRPRLSRYLDAGMISTASWLASSGQHFEIDDTSSSPANIYVPLNASYWKVFIFKDESARLLQSDFSLSWLGCLLLDMGPHGEIFIEICDHQERYPDAIVTLSYIRTRLPSTAVEVVDGTWICLHWAPALADEIKVLQTIYHSVHGSYEEFVSEWLRELEVDGPSSPMFKKQVSIATYQFRYTLNGANVKGFAVKRLIDKWLNGKQICGLDIAGGFGFAAAELAASGHTYGMLEYQARFVNVGRRFLERRKLTSRVTFQQGDVRDINLLASRFDVVSCFEALYSIGKEIAPKLLRETMNILEPGGFLIIKEALKGDRGSDDPFYPKLFELQELIDCLTANAGIPFFYDPVTYQKIPRDKLRTNYLTTFVRKPVEGTAPTEQKLKAELVADFGDGNSSQMPGDASLAEDPRETYVAPEPAELWPEAVIDYGERYRLLPYAKPRTGRAGSLSIRNFGQTEGGGEAAGGDRDVLNPKIDWPPEPEAQCYQLSITDSTHGSKWLNTIVKETSFQIPLTHAFLPGHTYSIKVQAKGKSGWGEWSPEKSYRVAGVAEGVHAAKRQHTAPPRSATGAGREILALAECLREPSALRQALRPYFAKSEVYRELIDRICRLGYRFKATQHYTPDDLGKPFAFLRLDLHLRDIVGTYGIIDANLDLNIPADFHVTWELTPYERSRARDYWNLRKMASGTDLVQFGFHTNPVRSWLVASRFGWNVKSYGDWDGNGESTREFIALARTGKCSLGTYDEFMSGARTIFYALSYRFKKHFPEAKTLSGHGNINGLRNAMKVIDRDEDPLAWGRLNSLEVNTLTTKKEMYEQCGYIVNHTEPYLAHREHIAWLFDPIRDGAIVPEKWRVIENAAQRAKTLFFYIHPWTVFNP